MLSQDHMILKRPHERAVLTDMGIGAFFLKDTITGLCQIVRTVVRNWPEMKRIGKTTDRPFLYLVSETGVKPMRRKKLG